jgi:hypothetical protein
MMKKVKLKRLSLIDNLIFDRHFTNIAEPKKLKNTEYLIK